MLLDEFPFYLIDFLTILYIRNLGYVFVLVLKLLIQKIIVLFYLIESYVFEIFYAGPFWAVNGPFWGDCLGQELELILALLNILNSQVWVQIN